MQPPPQTRPPQHRAERSPPTGGRKSARTPTRTPKRCSESDPAAIALRNNGDTSSDRAALFALLSRCLPWSKAAAASQALLERYNSIVDVAAAPEAELADFPSLGASGAAIIKCVHAVAVQLSSAPIRNAPILSRWCDLEKYLFGLLSRETKEQFRVLFLNGANYLISDELISIGSINFVHVYPREIIKRCLELRATAIILVHNHPSGSLSPSYQDIQTTMRVESACGTLDIVLHDHLLVSGNGLVSFRQLGLLNAAESV